MKHEGFTPGPCGSDHVDRTSYDIVVTERARLAEENERLRALLKSAAKEIAFRSDFTRESDRYAKRLHYEIRAALVPYARAALAATKG